jgi:hypothetical protein
MALPACSAVIERANVRKATFHKVPSNRKTRGIVAPIPRFAAA